MKLNRCLILFLIPLLFLLSSCDRACVISARAGKEFTIRLDSNPTTGYSWQLAEPYDESIVRLLEAEYIPSTTKRVGAGGEEKWTFQALKKGTAKISLKYARPWEINKPPAKEKVFLIRVR